jgi:RNA recognition motif-containing protein
MGYGFLIFDSKEAADKALLDLKGKIMPNTDKKIFKLNYAAYNDRKNENEHSMYVCDLSTSVNSEKLISFFKSKYNSVIGGKIIIDPSTKISKGYGFVTFSDEKEKEKAIVEMNGKILNNKAIKTGNAWYKKNDRNKRKNNHFKTNHPFFPLQQYQQLYNNPFFIANNYYANFFNPLFQQQMYSQLEEYLNNTDDSDRNDLKNSENNPIKEVNY